ncbi:MAG: hypothetical protein ACJA2X_001841 [Halocynthiibacter sp.]|jgi:hypothetical protein
MFTKGFWQMGRLAFYIARLIRAEEALKRYSVERADLLASLSGKTVAIVGNARALAQAEYGAKIDAHDVVIRINRAPMPQAQSHGKRTDILAMATRVSIQERNRIGARRFMWMSHKRKRLDWRVAMSPGFYLHPLSDYDDLKRRLGKQPTTGAMVIDLVSQSAAAKIDLYGFDFFASLSLSGSRSAAQTPHDFDAEAAWVSALIAADPRLTLHSME